MQVQITHDFELRMNSTDTRVWLKGWTGDMPDEIATQAIKAKKAQPLVLNNDTKPVAPVTTIAVNPARQTLSMPKGGKS
jgi:hypothetical protein